MVIGLYRLYILVIYYTGCSQKNEMQWLRNTPKMYNIFSYHRNENSNYFEFSSYGSQNGQD